MDVETVFIAAAFVAVAAGVLAASIGRVPSGMVAITRRFGVETGIRQGTFFRLPIIDSDTRVSIVPFSRSSVHRSSTSDGLDVGVSLRIVARAFDAVLFGGRSSVFDHHHDELIVTAITDVVTVHEHDEILAAPQGLAAEIRSRLVSAFAGFGLAIDDLVVERLAASRVGRVAHSSRATQPVFGPTATGLLRGEHLADRSIGRPLLGAIGELPSARTADRLQPAA